MKLKWVCNSCDNDSPCCLIIENGDEFMNSPKTCPFPWTNEKECKVKFILEEGRLLENRKDYI